MNRQADFERSGAARWPGPVLAALLALLALACSPAQAVNIDHRAITVSGISAGGIMAQQLHLAYPEVYSGLGVLAGAPWGCAAGSLARALGQCTGNGDQLPAVEGLVDTARQYAADGRIGKLELLTDDRLWLFHGQLDSAVARQVTDGVQAFYARWLQPPQLAYITDVAAAHHFPTLDQGHACDQVASPYLGACGFDAAGALLSHLYPGLETPADVPPELELQQLALPEAAAAGLLDSAWLYLPPTCPASGCRLHVVLHGCGQSSAQVGEQFMRQAGYLRWARHNGLVLAFPQVAPSAVNPLACWDWWGYTGADYLTREAVQIKLITDWVKGLGGQAGAGTGSGEEA